MLLGLVVVGLLLRLSALGDSLYGDELSTFYVVSGHGLERVIYLLSGHVTTELNPPLYFVTAWLTEQVADSSVQSLRFISLLAGVALIPLTYVLGRWTVGVRAGLVGAAAVTLSPFLIFYSSEARPYGLMTVLCLLSTLALLKAVKTTSLRWFAAYAVCSCAAMYTHFTAVFVLLGQFGWALFTQPQARRALIAANIAAAIGFSPWLPIMLKAARSPLTAVYGILGPFTLHQVRIDLGQLAIGHPVLPVATLPGDVAAALALAGVLVAGLGSLIRARTDMVVRGSRWSSPDLALVVILALAAPVGAGLYSSLRHSIWDARNLLSSWPGFAVLLGALLTYPSSRWRLVAVPLVIAALAVGSVKSLQTRYQRPNYLAAADYIDRVGTDREPVVHWADLTPGPPTELEAAFALRKSARPIFRLGRAPLSAVLRSPPYAILSPLPGQVVASTVTRLAGGGGLFLVLPARISVHALDTLRRAHVSSSGTSNFLVLLAAFLGALPARFHVVDVRSYAGIHPVTVYTFAG